MKSTLNNRETEKYQGQKVDTVKLTKENTFGPLISPINDA
jgi:hypothetical protein